MTDRELLPDFLIAGAPRCGTTWLWTNVSAHPEIFMPNRKELHFFDRHYEEGMDWYKEFFKGSGSVVRGEATPAYLYSDEVLDRIATHLPWVKILIMVRNPVDRAYSHYWHRETERRREGISQTFEEKIKETPRLVNEGIYARHIAKYVERFGKDRVAVFLQDDIRRDPDALLESIYRFLGVDTSFRPGHARNEINSSKIKAGRSRFLYKLNRALLKLNLPDMARVIERLNYQAPPGLAPDLRNALLDQYYREDIEQLEALIGRDLSTWKESTRSDADAT